MDFLTDVVLHHFWLSVYGLLFWFTLVWGIDKTRAESKGNRLLFFRWWNFQSDDIIIAIMMAFGFLAFDDEILVIWQKYYPDNAPKEFYSFIYLLVGPISDGLYKIITKIKSNGK